MKINLNKSLVIKILIIALCSIGFVFISLWAYRQYKVFKEPLLPAINAIPDNTAFFLEIKNYNELWKKLNKPNSIYKTISEASSLKHINQQIISLDSLIKTNSEILNIISSQSVYIVITINNNNELNTIFLIGLSNKHQSTTISKFIENYKKNKYIINDISENKLPLFEITSENKNNNWYYSLFKGVFIIGKNKKEVFSSILKLNSNEYILNKDIFNKIYYTAGKNVDANFYLNLTYFKNLMLKLFDNHRTINYIANNIINGWVALDVKINEQNILLNGFTNNQDTSTNLLNLLKKEEPQPIRVTNVMPDNTSMFFYLAFNNFEEFKKGLIKLNKDVAHEIKIKNINSQYNIEIEKYFKYWIGNEMVTFSIPNQTDEAEPYNFIALNAIDKKTASERLFELADKTANKSNSSEKTAIYKNFKIGKINISNLLPIFIGFMANNIKQNYFTIIDNYVVFGNSLESLQLLINKTIEQHPLSKNENYQSLAKNLSDKASIYLYINFTEYKQTFKNVVTPAFKTTIEQNYKTFDKFNFFALQIIPENNLFYNTICLDYKTSMLNKSAFEEWQIDLDTTIISKPFIIQNFIDKSFDILVYDAANKLYLIDKNGNIKWKKPINDKILSGFYQIDYYKNGKLQLLFNTKDYIYLIDRNGKNVEDFPIKLKSKATNGLLAVYYPDLNDYRIYIACENKKVICLNKTANLVDGWQFKNTKYIVKTTMQRFNSNNSDYLTIVDTTNKLYIIDRKGLSKLQIDSNLYISKNNSITFNNNIKNKGNSLVFTNKNGEITIIQLPNGNINKKHLKDYSPDHLFISADLNKDNKKEYLFISNTDLEIYDQSLKLIYTYQFSNSMLSTPTIIDFLNQPISFAINDNRNGRLFLFSYTNNNFNIATTIPSSEYYSITNNSNNQHINIYTTSARTLLHYKY